MREQLTFFSEPVAGIQPAPYNSPHKGFVYGLDIGGNEQLQYYFFDIEKRKSYLITDGKSKNMSGTWSDNGEHFLSSSNARKSSIFEVYCVRMEDIIRDVT